MVEGQAPGVMKCEGSQAVKAKYFSDIIERNCHRPRVLFSTINFVINPPDIIGPDISGKILRDFSFRRLKKY